MTTSPERCLGTLLKDLDEEDSPRDYYSKDETAYKTSTEQKLSLDSVYSFHSSSIHMPFHLEKFDFQLNYSKDVILSFFQNQKDTIQLQKCLINSSQEDRDYIINELSGTFNQIIKNQNGNYFFTDLYIKCDNKQRIKILKELKDTICDDCKNEFGTHPIQKIIENSKSEEEYKLILSSFKNADKILSASLDLNGSYVIQKIFVCIPEIYRMEFNINYLKFLIKLSMSKYGVCTAKKYIEKTDSKAILKQISDIIVPNFFIISGNQYGNYLAQFILEFWWNKNEGIPIKKLCIHHFETLAKKHYSSYICDLLIKLMKFEEKKGLYNKLKKEKCLERLNHHDIGKIIVNKLSNAIKKEKNIKKKNIPFSTTKPPESKIEEEEKNY